MLKPRESILPSRPARLDLTLETVINIWYQHVIIPVPCPPDSASSSLRPGSVSDSAEESPE